MLMYGLLMCYVWIMTVKDMLGYLATKSRGATLVCEVGGTYFLLFIVLSSWIKLN